MNNNAEQQTPTREEMLEMVEGTRNALRDLKANKESLTDNEKEQLAEIVKELEALKTQKLG